MGQCEEGAQNTSSLFLFYFVSFHLLPFPGLKAADRTSVQNEWMEEKIPVIVATISFGMGVDKANVRFVKLSVVLHQRLKPEQQEGQTSVSITWYT